MTAKDNANFKEGHRRKSTGKPNCDPYDSYESEDDKPSRSKNRDKKINKSKKSAARDTSDEGPSGTVSDRSDDSSLYNSDGSSSGATEKRRQEEV